MARNSYYGKRNLPLLGEVALARYQGTQMGAKARGGFTVPVASIEASPFASIQYFRLNRAGYTEKNAPSANLAVDGRQVSGMQLGFGLKIAEISQAEEFLPEIHAMYLYDLRLPSMKVTSRFVNGGSDFISDGPVPPKSGVNLGGSISMMVDEDFLITGGYDMEVKKSFNSHSVSCKFKWLF